MGSPETLLSRLADARNETSPDYSQVPQFQTLEPRLLLSAFVSDDFSSTELNLNLWQLIDPVGDSSLVLDGTNAVISVPAGVSHDVWESGNKAPHLMQAATDEDFEIEVKFETRPEGRFAVNGIIIEQDGNNFLRFDFHSSGSRINLFAASFDNGNPSAEVYKPISGNDTMYMRVNREGNLWTQSFSYDGQSWIVGGSFYESLSVSSVGFFVGNEGTSPPAYTGSIDYFFDTSSPVYPEDGELPDTTPPTIQDVIFSADTSSIQIDFTTDETANAYVEYGLTTAYELGSVASAGQTTHSVLLDNLQDATTYQFRIAATDQAGNTSYSDNFSTTTDAIPDTTAPEIQNISTQTDVDNIQIDFETNEPASIVIEYGLTTGYELGSISGPEALTHSLTLEGLQTNTTYQCRIVATDQAGNTSYSDNLTETTLAEPDTAAPQIQNVIVTAGVTTIQIDFTTDEPATIAIEYGLTTSYELGSISGPEAQTHSITIDNLQPETTYQLRIVATDTAGNTSYSQNLTATTAPLPPVTGIQSDDFSSTLLDDIWEFIDPVGDSSIVLNGTNVLITVPGGTAHDVWENGNNTARLMQSATDEDFEIEVKFESRPQGRYAVNGIIIEQDSDNFLRFDFHSSGSRINLFAASFDNGNPSAEIYKGISGSSTMYMRVTRSGDLWTVKYSYNGTSWSTGGSFNAALTVTSAGPFVGNEGSSPPTYTGSIDYFFNTASPIDPEDPDLTPPEINNVNVQPDVDTLQINFDTDEPATVLIEYGLTTNYELGSVSGALGTSHSLTLEGLQADTTYQYHIIATDQSDNVGDSGNLTATTDPPPDINAPLIQNINVEAGEDFLRITFDTDEEATASVDYGRTLEYELGNIDSPAGTSHTILIEDLYPETLYNFKITATDIAGNTSQTQNQTAQTSPSINADERIIENLVALYTFEDKGGNTVSDISGVGDAMDLIIGDPGNVTWADYTLTVNNATILSSAGAATKLIDTITQTNEITIEAWLTPTNVTQDGPARIITLSTDTSERNFTLGQGLWGSLPSDTIDVRFRTTATDLNGQPSLTTSAGTMSANLTHVVFTRNIDGNAKVYINNSLVAEDVVAGDLSNWDTTYAFALANEITGGRPWFGTFHLAAIYSQALTAGQIAQNYNAGVFLDEENPEIQNVTVDAGEQYLQINFATNENTSAIIEYGLTTNYELGSVTTPTGITHSARLEDLQPDTTYHIRITVTDPSGNSSQSDDITLRTATPMAPYIDVWYGNLQNFGQNGNPQQFVNILGNVSDPNGVASLTYTLNGGNELTLSRGPDTRRLEYEGDFNIEIDIQQLNSGSNTIEIKATDYNGYTSINMVTVDYTSGQTWPLSYTADWNNVQDISQAAQVVDGYWKLEDGAVRTVELGYDRIIAIGDMSWTDYEVVVPVTIHGFDPAGFDWPSVAPSVNIVARWQGHYDWTGEQPRHGWYPLGAIASYGFKEDPQQSNTLGLYGNNAVSLASPIDTQLEFDVTYLWKVRVDTINSSQTRYRFKVWEQGTSEPSGWDLSGVAEGGLNSGSVLLMAHHTDVSYGSVYVRAV